MNNPLKKALDKKGASRGSQMASSMIRIKKDSPMAAWQKFSKNKADQEERHKIFKRKNEDN